MLYCAEAKSGIRLDIARGESIAVLRSQRLGEYSGQSGRNKQLHPKSFNFNTFYIFTILPT